MQQESKSIEVGGRTRTYTVVEPEGTAPSRALVLIFQGSRQNGVRYRKFTGGSFDVLAEDDAATVVYLDGHKGHWNDARRISSFAARKENVDDIAFTRAVIERLTGSHGVDPHRVWA